MGKTVAHIRKDPDMLDDFTLIFTRANPATPYLVSE